MARYWECGDRKFTIGYDPRTGLLIEKPYPNAKVRARMARLRRKAKRQSHDAGRPPEDGKDARK